MMTFILVIHSIACILLVLTVLMQAGRGGGLTESFSSAENVFGAQTSAFMVRATSILAAVFFVTSLSLAFLSSKQDRSLMANKAVSKQAVQSNLDKTQKAANQKLEAVMPAVESNDAKIDAQAVPAVVNAQK